MSPNNRTFYLYGNRERDVPKKIKCFFENCILRQGKRSIIYTTFRGRNIAHFYNDCIMMLRMPLLYSLKRLAKDIKVMLLRLMSKPFLPYCKSFLAVIYYSLRQWTIQSITVVYTVHYSRPYSPLAETVVDNLTKRVNDKAKKP